MKQSLSSKIFWGSSATYWLWTILLIALAISVSAAELTKTPRLIAPADISYLRAQLAASDTSMTLDPLKKWVNGVETEGCFNTGSGFIIIEDDLGRKEWASFGGKSCDASNITTLSSLRRGLAVTAPSFSSGTGLAFDAGAVVRTIDYTQIYNMTVYRDLPNYMTGSGSLDCQNTTQPCAFLGDYTTAQRDAFTYVKDGAIIYNSTLDILQSYNAGAWVTLAGSGTINATETAAGKVQVGTLDALLNRTQTGSTGAANALTFKWIVKNGSGAGTAGYVLQAGANGALSPSLGGTGIPSPTQSGVLVGNGAKNSMLQVGGTSGQVLGFNSKLSVVARSLTPELVQWTQPNEKILSIAGDVNFATNYSIPSGTATGSVFMIETSGTGGTTSTLLRYGLKLGSTEVCAGNYGTTAGTAWKIRGELTVIRNGAGGRLSTNCIISHRGDITSSGSVVAINTTGANAVNVFLKTGGTSAYAYMINLFVFRFTR